MKASILKGPSAKELSEKNFEFGLVTSGGGGQWQEREDRIAGPFFCEGTLNVPSGRMKINT